MTRSSFSHVLHFLSFHCWKMFSFSVPQYLSKVILCLSSVFPFTWLFWLSFLLLSCVTLKKHSEWLEGCVNSVLCIWKRMQLHWIHVLLQLCLTLSVFAWLIVHTHTHNHFCRRTWRWWLKTWPRRWTDHTCGRHVCASSAPPVWCSRSARSSWRPWPGASPPMTRPTHRAGGGCVRLRLQNHCDLQASKLYNALPPSFHSRRLPTWTSFFIFLMCHEVGSGNLTGLQYFLLQRISLIKSL